MLTPLLSKPGQFAPLSAKPQAPRHGESGVWPHTAVGQGCQAAASFVPPPQCCLNNAAVQFPHTPVQYPYRCCWYCCPGSYCQLGAVSCLASDGSGSPGLAMTSGSGTSLYVFASSATLSWDGG